MKSNSGQSTTHCFRNFPKLLPRIRDFILSSNEKVHDAEEVTQYLQRKYPEYNRKKYRYFLRVVQDGMTKLEEDADCSVLLSNLCARKRKLENDEEVLMLDDAPSERSDFKTIDSIYENRNGTMNKSLLALYSNGNMKTTNEELCKSKSKVSNRGNHTTVPKTANADDDVKASRTGIVASNHFKIEQPVVKFHDLGGCESQFLDVCRLSMHLKHPEIHELLGVVPPRGFLLHGPPGCGKTLFAQAVAGELQLPLLKLSSTELVSGISGQSEELIRDLFTKAAEIAPCVLLIDEIDAIAPKRDSVQREMERRIVSQLLSCLDDLYVQRSSSSPQLVFAKNGDVGLNEEVSKGSRHVLVIGTTNRPESIDAALRRAGRFDKEISLGIPDERARTKILEILCKNVRLADTIDLKTIARLTPGYVGADLLALAREASMCAVNRIFNTAVQSHCEFRKLNIAETCEELQKMLVWLKSDETLDELKLANLFVTFDDFNKALRLVHPSAKREGFATVPDVSWNDIGALSEVREELKWSILYPIKRPEDFELLAIESKPQGILLCGPPGCGKTLLAKAVANETGMNFISIKGPELLSMYVGESERAVRTVFQRARDSSPCVIFFDEIDALCPKRSGNENSGSGRLVNQLLTEMDGMESRKEVFLIGATNRPDIVDPAVLRPGRLDKILFVDFPNAKDRADILLKTTRNRTHPRIAADVCFEGLANDSRLEWFTGADLAALVHEASVVALKARLSSDNCNIDALTMDHFNQAMNAIQPSVSANDRKKYLCLKSLYGRR